jgi:hypothetical protein
MLRFSAATGLVLSVCFVGCAGSGDNPPTSEVTGVVTYQGTPLSSVTVTFMPQNGRPAMGITDEQGQYVLSTFEENDGALPGTHSVTITNYSQEFDPMPGTPEYEEAQKNPKPPRFPARYSDPTQSDLTAEVKPGEENEFPFDLTD